MQYINKIQVAVLSLVIIITVIGCGGQSEISPKKPVVTTSAKDKEVISTTFSDFENAKDSGGCVDWERLKLGEHRLLVSYYLDHLHPILKRDANGGKDFDPVVDISVSKLKNFLQNKQGYAYLNMHFVEITQDMHNALPYLELNRLYIFFTVQKQNGSRYDMPVDLSYIKAASNPVTLDSNLFMACVNNFNDESDALPAFKKVLNKEVNSSEGNTQMIQVEFSKISNFINSNTLSSDEIQIELAQISHAKYNEANIPIPSVHQNADKYLTATFRVTIENRPIEFYDLNTLCPPQCKD